MSLREEMSCRAAFGFCRAASRMGASGKFFRKYVASRAATNEERSFHQLNRRLIEGRFPGGQMLQPYFIEVPLKGSRNPREIVWEMIPIILPMDVLTLMQLFGKLGDTLHGPNVQEYNARFWDNAIRMGWGQAPHPISSLEPEDRAQACPILWFADDVKSYKGSGADVCFCVWSWGCPGARGPTRRCRHYVMQLPTWRMLPETNTVCAAV